MIQHEYTPGTPCVGAEPLAAACQEKLRLRLQFAIAARRFLESLNGYLALNGGSCAARTERKNTTDEARKACEQAMEALEAHRAAHRC